MIIKRSPPINTKYKTALVTGASSGIGAAIARKLAGEGLTVVLVARRLERLNQLANEIKQTGGDCIVIDADLSSATERKQVYSHVLTGFESLDVLVNNAGLGWYGYYADMPWDVASELMEVNMTAVAHLTGLFLHQMREQNRGHIINIGSVAGSFPNQGVALYSASKSFLDAFNSVLHRELRGTKVCCSIVRAGPVSTEFFDQAANRQSGLRVPAERFAVPPELIAKRVHQLLLRPRKVIYTPSLLAITPWIELFFGRIIDRIGPLLLKQTNNHAASNPD